MGKMMAGDRARPQAGQAGQAGPAERLKAMFEKMDADGNGTISREEAPERMKQNFDRVDTNGDGVLDRSELKVMFEKMMQGRRPDGAANSEGRPLRDGEDKPKRDGERRPRGEGERNAPQKPKRPAAE